MDAKMGDKVQVPIDFSGLLGENALVKLVALMVFET